jgi:hypothetical protein
MDRTWEGNFKSYRGLVREDSPAGTKPVSFSMLDPAPGRQIQILFPARSFSPGRYELSILGTDAAGRESKVAGYCFTLRF